MMTLTIMADDRYRTIIAHLATGPPAVALDAKLHGAKILICGIENIDSG